MLNITVLVKNSMSLLKKVVDVNFHVIVAKRQFDRTRIDQVVFLRNLLHLIGFGLDCLLHEISGVSLGEYSNEAERLTGGALARLNFTGISEVQARGLHLYIDDMQALLNEIGQEIFETYVLLPSAVRRRELSERRE